jgi:hypothetical protein
MLHELIISPIILFLLLCENGLTRCGDRCVDLQADLNHCGSCSNECNLANAVSKCANGACAIQSCDTGYMDCDGKPANGCEVNTNNDANHCGSCNVPCLLGQCSNSVCCIPLGNAGCTTTHNCCFGECSTSGPRASTCCLLTGYGNCNLDADCCSGSCETTTGLCSALGCAKLVQQSGSIYVEYSNFPWTPENCSFVCGFSTGAYGDIPSYYSLAYLTNTSPDIEGRYLCFCYDSDSSYTFMPSNMGCPAVYGDYNYGTITNFEDPGPTDTQYVYIFY